MNSPARFLSASKVSHVASAAGLVFLLLAAAGSKPNASGSASDAGTTTTTQGEVADGPKVSVSGTNVPNFEYVRAACDTVAKGGACDEYYGVAPAGFADSCKSRGGKWVATYPMPSVCPKEKLIGTCHYPQSKPGDPGVFTNYYANNPESVGELKKECLDYPVKSVKTEWIDPPAPAAIASAAAASKAAGKTTKPVPATTANTAKAKTK